MRTLITIGLILVLVLSVLAQEAQKETPFDKDIHILQLIIEKNAYQTQLAQNNLKELIQKREEWLKAQQPKPEEKK
jgi:hypothetical protein